MISVEVERSRSFFGIRHLQAAMIFLGLFLICCVRTSMSLAIVAMTDQSQNNTFAWNPRTKNLILSSFNWGYIALMIPSGELARRFGGMPLLTFAMAINSLACLLLPVSTNYGGWTAVCVWRALQGLGMGIFVPGQIQLLSKWVPIKEKGQLVSFILSGAELGNAMQLLLAGYIADIWSWPGIFYVDGFLGVIWTVSYFFIGSNSPQTSKIISEQERSYIQTSLQQVNEKKKLKTPWKAILTSIPFYSLVISSGGFSWGHWMLLTETPSYMKVVLGVDIKSNGVLSAIPHLTMCLLCFPMGWMSDYILKKKWLSVTHCRKMFNSVSSFGPAIALIAICFIPSNAAILVTIMSISQGLSAGYFTGDALVYLDMSPNFASVLTAISHCTGSVVALNAPLVAGLLITDEKDPRKWHNVFFSTSGVYIVTNIIFLIFGTSKRQTWNEPDDEKEKESVNKKT